MKQLGLQSLQALAAVLALVAGVGVTPLHAHEFGTGPAPITHWAQPPLKLSQSDVIVIEGKVIGSTATLVLRVDDRKSPAYADRFNDERTLQPGPFRWQVPATALNATSGRALNLSNIQQIVLFPTGGARVEVSAFRTVTAKPGARTLLLGTGPAPVSFKPRSPMDARSGWIVLEGVVAKRPSGDAAPTATVLRIDDGKSAGYASRINIERQLPPGPFKLQLGLDGLKTPSGRLIDTSDIRLISFWPLAAAAPITITRFELARSRQSKAATARSAAPAPIKLKTGSAAAQHRFSRPLDASGRIAVIEGRVTQNENKVIVLRIDDGLSNGYANRVNIERSLPPGPFKMRVPLDGQRTPSGRVLNMADLRLIAFWPFPTQTGVTLDRFELIPAPTLPVGAKGYALGADDAQLPPGFERIGPRDKRISGPAITARRRPMPDPLVANGLAGLSQIRLPARPGRYRVTIWSEDPGDWEFLPHPLRRRITVNGSTLLSQTETPASWLRNRYLRAAPSEHTTKDNAWTAYGRHRGNRKSVEVDVADRGIVIDIDGDTPDARFISAVLIEPVGSNAALTAAIRAREDWYRSNWRVVPQSAARAARQVDPFQARTLHLGAAQAAPVEPLSARAGRGGAVRFTISVKSKTAVAQPNVALTAPQRAGKSAKLPAKVWAGLNKLLRRPANENLLRLSDDTLVADVGRLSLAPAHPRRYEIWVSIPQTAKPGRYIGSFQISDGNTKAAVPIEIDVLDVALPKIAKPVGFYLAYRPHLSWLRATKADRHAQARCDMQLLTSFGLTGSTPAVAAPLKNGLSDFLGELNAADRAGFAHNALLYDPLRTLRYAYGVDRTAKFAGAAVAAIRARKLPMPVFTAADEPSNPDQSSALLRAYVAALRKAAGPHIRLAGHLNAPADRAFVDLFDVLIINASFGIDAKDIAREASKGRTVWLYNTWRHRLTAGAWLHTTEAQRYVQWHANLPTADPFDPLDGREGDAQVIYPSARICEPRPTIDRELLQLAEGAIDQRWLQWLQLQKTPAARTLARQLRSEIGESWTAATKLTAADLGRMRRRIIELAAGSKKHRTSQ